MPETMLTDEEHALLAKISEVSEGFSQLIRPGDHHISACDWDEVAAHIHVLQTRVLAMAGARAYPNLYRGLCGQAGGEWLRERGWNPT